MWRLSRVARVAILVVGLAAMCGCAADPVEAKRTASTTILEASVSDDEPGCSAAVAVDGDVVWAEARGLANVDTGAEFETSTPIHIGSVGKQFTAMAVLMLADRGDLSLDESPAVYLDGLPAWAEDLTVNDLMHHTSGINDVLSMSLSNFGTPPLRNADALEFVRTSPLAHLGTPGEFDYSNTNYALLADIVAEVTGTEFAAWMETNVFAPLDLEARIGPPVPSDPRGYKDVGAEFSEVEAWPWVLTGPGFVTMTLSDLVRWGDELREPSLVSAETLADAMSNGAPVDDGYTYGPGLLVSPDGVLEHDGAGAGHYTAFGVSADRHTAAAVSCNQDGIDMAGIGDELVETWFTERTDH
ncbi:MULTISPECIES: serine hydrolase domain-containing protein [unclassified Microbacterium]|uniref:serine hydrolase domain-containing protein n=1 Tax=unclassified Microbacterium TaxID=2609290 RepID=UPI00214C97D5|nr:MULTISPECIES: serine hydrolase domain-containing protein [unclassified Microbacterium]MCR2799605.1 beta-lactamase family protein [Microbacterium sp. zg.Y818]MCR2827208.1 beta-lactamase family protein [Microbacterium sp. zg.Y909]WIM21598.1 serine hydrolase domain-containing protein [Microbacterium sp. zg-Y818]